MSITEINSKYGIAKLIINEWIKANKKVKVSDEDFMTMKKVAKLLKIIRIKENKILKTLWP